MQNRWKEAQFPPPVGLHRQAWRLKFSETGSGIAGSTPAKAVPTRPMSLDKYVRSDGLCFLWHPWDRAVTALAGLVIECTRLTSQRQCSRGRTPLLASPPWTRQTCHLRSPAVRATSQIDTAKRACHELALTCQRVEDGGVWKQRPPVMPNEIEFAVKVGRRFIQSSVDSQKWPGLPEIRLWRFGPELCLQGDWVPTPT